MFQGSFDHNLLRGDSVRLACMTYYYFNVVDYRNKLLPIKLMSFLFL